MYTKYTLLNETAKFTLYIVVSVKIYPMSKHFLFLLTINCYLSEVLFCHLIDQNDKLKKKYQNYIEKITCFTKCQK